MMNFKETQIQNSLIYLMPLAVNSVLPIIVISVFTRILTKEDFGLWGLAQVYGIFATGVTNFGMLTAYERNYFQFRNDKLKSAQLLYSTLGFVLANFSIVAGLTYGFRNYLSGLVTGSDANGTILFFAFCGHFSHSILSYYLTFFKNTENATDYSRHVIAFSLLNLGFSLIFVAWLRIGVIGLIYAQLAAGTIVFFMLTLKFASILNPAFSPVILKESISIAYPLTPRIFLGVISSQFDKYMIGLMATIGGVGIYSIGQKVASAIFSIMTAIQNVFSPQVYRRMFDGGDEGGRQVGTYLTPFAYVCVAPAIMIVLFAEELFSVLTPSSFHGAVDIVIILAMFYSVMFFGKQPQLVYAKKTGITSFLSIMGVGLNIALNIPFIMKWGANGAAWATLLAGMISTAIHFLISQHYYRIEWEYKKIFFIYAIFFISAFSGLLLKDFFQNYTTWLFVKFLFFLMYIRLGMKIGVISRDNWSHVKDIISGKFQLALQIQK
jgi:O-antigen/teichoic acid export membrane protein